MLDQLLSLSISVLSLQVSVAMAQVSQIPLPEPPKVMIMQEVIETPAISVKVVKTAGKSVKAEHIAAAIKRIESGGNYSARGKDGEYGAWQWRASTWAVQAKKYLGNAKAPMTRKNQDAVALGHIRSLLGQGYSAYEIALIWNGGSPTVKKGITNSGVRYNSGIYANKVIAFLPV